MDDRKFDSLVKSFASGTSRRSLLKGMLGLGGAALTGSVVLDGDSEAARRPTPTPKPIQCPGQANLERQRLRLSSIGSAQMRARLLRHRGAMLRQRVLSSGNPMRRGRNLLSASRRVDPCLPERPGNLLYDRMCRDAWWPRLRAAHHDHHDHYDNDHHLDVDHIDDIAVPAGPPAMRPGSGML